MQDVASVVQAEMAEVEAQEMQLGEELQLSLCLPGEKNTDRLRRNRESAKRCRLRRKEYIMGVESKCTTLEQQNESLVLENRRLQQLVQQLMDKKSYEDTDASPCAKRVKLENGVTAADFNTESAETQHSQQLETVTDPLARVTTILFLIASTHLVSSLLTTVWTQATIATQTAAKKPNFPPMIAFCTSKTKHSGLTTSLWSNSYYDYHRPIS
jgi:hypothetical protein